MFSVAIEAIKINAALNGVTVNTSADNFIGQVLSTDVVIIGDLFYDENITKEITSWLPLLNAEVTIIGDPGRLAWTPLVAHLNILPVAVYQLSNQMQEENNGLLSVTVWKLLYNCK